MDQFFNEHLVTRSAMRAILPTSQEHVVSRYVCTVLRYYYTTKEEYTITPEQIQEHGKKPDYVVEKLIDTEDPYENELPKFKRILFVEVKRPKKNWLDTMTQVSDAAVVVADEEEHLCTYVAVVIGTQIGFFEYYNYRDELDQEDIRHHSGLTPVLLELPAEVKEEPLHISTRQKAAITYGTGKLFDQFGNTPCIFDFTLPHHRPIIHDLFTMIKHKVPPRLRDEQEITWFIFGFIWQDIMVNFFWYFICYYR